MASGFTTGTKTKSGSGFTGTSTKQSTSYTAKKKELNLESLAKKADIVVPEKKPKLSTFQRIGAGLSSFETGEALATGLEQKSVVAGAKSYAKGIAKGVASAFTGKDLGQTEKRTYKDVLEKAGVENKIAKYGLGFVGDVLLDPSTYFGGALAKGLVKGTKVATSASLKGVGKVAPKIEQGIRLAGQGVKDAGGKAFVFGYGTSKGLAEKTLEVTSKIGKAKEGIVRSNIDRLGTGTLSKGQQEELVSKLLAGKRAEYAGKTGSQAIDVAKSTDPLVQKTITEQSARSQKFARNAGVDDPYTVYFPGIAKDKLKNFFDSTKALRVGNEGYKKEFKNLLKDDELVRNPAEAFARREFDIAKDSIVRSELGSMVKQFGKNTASFKNADDALKAGFVPVKEKGMFGKVIGYLGKEDKKFIDNLISPEFTTIDAIAKHTGFDAVTSLFKRSVTGLFVPFHVRNYVSGMVQNFEVLGVKALSPKNIATGQRIALKLSQGKSFSGDTIKIGTKAHSLNDVMKPFEKRFGSSSSYIADIGDATKDTSKLIPKLSQKLNPLSQENVAFKTARAVGNFIETQQKATAYVTALRDGKNVMEALDLATRAGFDYRALTGLESKVLRRLIPFYSFTRKNIELQLRTLGENPQRINQVLNLMQSFQGEISPEEMAKLPDYAKEQGIVKTGETVAGLPEVAVGFGTPIEAFAQVFSSNPIRRIASTLNPLFKVPLERAFNKDFFRDRPLNEVVEATEYAKAPKFIKDFLNATEVQKTNKDGSKRTVLNADPHKLQLLRSMPTTRGATYLNAIYDEKLTTKSKILNALTGIKPRPIDLETVQYFRERDAKRELEDLLIRSGALKRFETVYKPKGSK